MTEQRQARDDLNYVRAVVRRAEGGANPASIYFLWAVISFFGYAIIDFDPQRTGLYWAVAGPLGGVASGWLGWRSGRRTGQLSSRDGLHWVGLFVAILLLMPLAVTGHLAPTELPRVILLLVALAYWSAGVYEDRRMLPVAAVTAALVAFTVLAAELRFLWTITAAVLAGSLAVTGLFAAAPQRSAE